MLNGNESRTRQQGLEEASRTSQGSKDIQAKPKWDTVPSVCRVVGGTKSLQDTGRAEKPIVSELREVRNK